LSLAETRLVAGYGLDYRSVCVSVNYLSGGAITISVFLEIGLVALWIAVGPGRQRRSHFWVRILLACLALPALLAVLIGIGRTNVLPDATAKPVLSFLFFAGVVALMFVPGLLYRRSGSPPGPSDSDGGGGWGPGRPRPSPQAPSGGIPLPDAEQARARARDHSAPKFDGATRRRPAHSPRRTPVRTSGSGTGVRAADSTRATG
jgi:hypothetical protein